MNHRNFYPSNQGDEPEWLVNFYTTLPSAGSTVGLSATEIADGVADARWLEYVIGSWLPVCRSFPEAATAAAKESRSGVGVAAQVLPVLAPPPLPAGDPAAVPPIPPVVPRPPGALDRLFRLVKDIKNKPAYTDTIGADLRVIGSEATTPALPKFSLKLLQGSPCQCVEIRYYKYGRTGVWIESRRGPGDWEALGLATKSPYLDERPLLAAGVPEVREYRMRFYDNGAPTGDWTPVQKTTVSP